MVVVDVEVSVATSLQDAWSTMTDYEHMASFVSNLKASQVLRREGNELEVAQSGQTKVAFMTFSFAVTRRIELLPMREIRSELLRGDFKTYSSTTTLTDESPHVRIVHHGEYMPKAWLPPMIGPAVIEFETRKQYTDFAAEMMRRTTAVRR